MRPGDSTIGYRGNYYSSNDPSLTVEMLNKSSDPWSLINKENGGTFIATNSEWLNDPLSIKTPLHELGHWVETALGPERIVSGNMMNSEVFSTLYGVRASQIYSQREYKKSLEMIAHQAKLYNFIHYGTVAPY